MGFFVHSLFFWDVYYFYRYIKSILESGELELEINEQPNDDVLGNMTTVH